MKITGIILIVTATLYLTACQDKEYGFLDIRNIGYMPDTVVFKAALDPELEEDAQMIEFEIPWQSPGLQGVDGTKPVLYSIALIVPDNQATPETLSQFLMKGSGIIELPWNHTVPVGRYAFSVKIEAGSHTDIAENILTVIIQ